MLVLLIGICYLVAEVVPGRFAVTDELYFKAAGRNWAATGRFAAPELKGFHSGMIPPITDVFFTYPPLYPFLFGLYTKLAGFGARSCILYDALIHVLLVWTAFAAARRVFALPWRVAGLCGALFVPLGTVGRPDELGILLAFAAAMAFRMKTRPIGAALLGGALMGFCGLTSLGAAVFLGPIVAWELVLREDALLKGLGRVVLAALVAGGVATVCVAPLLISHPGAYRQLFSTAASQTIANQFNPAYQTPGLTFAHLWAIGLRYGYSQMLLTATLLAFATILWRLDVAPDRAGYSRVVVAALSLAVLAISMPGKYLYLWFASSWLLLTTVALGWRIWGALPPSRRRMLLAGGALSYLLLSLPYVRSKTILWTLPAGQRLGAGVARVRNDVPTGVGVLSTEYWWALADRDQVYDSTFSAPAPGDVNYVATSGNGAGQAGVPMLQKEYADWQLVDNALRQSAPTFFGLRLSRSAYGFGPYILKRSDGGG